MWKSFGANLTSRMDLVKLDRDTNDKSEHLIHDLNNPFDKKEFFEKYDLVTDIGNNEHPFNIAEAYRDHALKLCKKNGHMIIHQAYLRR